MDMRLKSLDREHNRWLDIAAIQGNLPRNGGGLYVSLGGPTDAMGRIHIHLGTSTVLLGTCTIQVGTFTGKTRGVNGYGLGR